MKRHTLGGSITDSSCELCTSEQTWVLIVGAVNLQGQVWPLETLKQHSWNLQQNLQQFGDRTVRKVIKTDDGSKRLRWKSSCIRSRSFGEAEANKTTSMTYNILINLKQFSSLRSFQLGSGGTFYHLNTAVLLLYFTGRKRKAACGFTTSNLQLSISRVQFCSSKGYLLRSIMQAAVVVILKPKKSETSDRG